MTTCRFCFQVTGVLKFLSHLDLLKLFNRALRRAELPAAYSEGFNPHLKISFGPPRGVGIEGLAEWGDLQLKTELPPDEVIQRLNNALPQGVRVTDARLLPQEPHPALMAVIRLAVYEAEFAPDTDWSALAERVQTFWQADKWEIERCHPKKGVKIIDVRRGVSKLELTGNKLLLEIPFAEAGAVKPKEVLQAVIPDDITYCLRRVGLYAMNEAGEPVLP